MVADSRLARTMTVVWRKSGSGNSYIGIFWKLERTEERTMRRSEELERERYEQEKKKERERRNENELDFFPKWCGLMTWSYFRAIRLNGRLRFELLHPCNTLGIAWDVNPLYFMRFQKSGSDGPGRAVDVSRFSLNGVNATRQSLLFNWLLYSNEVLCVGNSRWRH